MMWRFKLQHIYVALQSFSGPTGKGSAALTGSTWISKKSPLFLEK
jgi:hypothetical protein